VYAFDGKTTCLTLPFAPHQSYLVVFRNQLTADHIEVITRDGEQVFPGNGPVSYMNREEKNPSFFFTEPGNYQLKYASGKVAKIESKESLKREIHGPWQVAFSKDWDAPGQIRFDQLVAWNEHPDPGIQVYSGSAWYGVVPGSG
jgi:hypothetical protein